MATGPHVPGLEFGPEARCVHVRFAVIGAGVIGLSTAAALLDSGAQITCYEAVGPMSQRSSGASRIFRLAHALPELVDLAMAARRDYGEWEARAGTDLLSGVGTVMSGGDLTQWAAAMSEAGAHFEVVDPQVGGRDLPVKSLTGPVLIDSGGGVIDARRTGEFLVDRVGRALVRDRVRELEPAGFGVRIRSDAGWESYDAAVIVAGSQTGALGAQVGIPAPTTFAHHVRFTFALHDSTARPPCLIDRSEAWRSGFTTYQHLVAPGRWAVGAHLPLEQIHAELGREAVIDTSRQLAVEYVRQNLRNVGDEPLEELYCDIIEGWGDGFAVMRNGGFLALYGDNLFKLAPILGRILGRATLSGGTPASVGLPAVA